MSKYKYLPVTPLLSQFSIYYLTYWVFVCVYVWVCVCVWVCGCVCRCACVCVCLCLYEGRVGDAVYRMTL